MPGTGRNTSCWCSCAVPPLSAPPTRLRLACSKLGGVNTCRPRISERKPGASVSTCCSMRSANAAVSRSSQLPVSSPPASPRIFWGTCVGPGRLSAGGGPGGVKASVLTHHEVGLAGDQAAGHLRGVAGQGVDPFGHVNGARPPGPLALPGGRPVQRPIDLDGRVVVLELAQTVQQGRRQRRAGQQLAVQLRCPHVGDHRPVGRMALVRGQDRPGPTAADLDRLRPRSAPDLATGGLQTPHERGRDLTGATGRRGEAMILGQRAQHPAERPAEGHLGADVAVQCVAGQQPRTAIGGEGLLAQAPDGEHGKAGEAQQLAGTEIPQQPERRPQRRERREERAQRPRAHPPRCHSAYSSRQPSPSPRAHSSREATVSSRFRATAGQVPSRAGWARATGLVRHCTPQRSSSIRCMCGEARTKG